MNYSVDQDSNRTLTLVLYVLYIIAIFSAGLLAVIALVINYINLSSTKYFSFLASFGKLAYLDLSNKPLSQP